MNSLENTSQKVIRVNKKLFLLLPYLLGCPCTYINQDKKIYHSILDINLLKKITDNEFLPNGIYQLTVYLKEVSLSSLSDEEFNLFLSKISNKVEINSAEQFREKIFSDTSGLFFLLLKQFDIFNLIGEGLAKSQSSKEFKECSILKI